MSQETAIYDGALKEPLNHFFRAFTIKFHFGGIYIVQVEHACAPGAASCCFITGYPGIKVHRKVYLPFAWAMSPPPQACPLRSGSRALGTVDTAVGERNYSQRAPKARIALLRGTAAGEHVPPVPSARAATAGTGVFTIGPFGHLSLPLRLVYRRVHVICFIVSMKMGV